MDANHYNKSFRLKTEKALQIINIYENNHSEVAKLSLLYGNTSLVQPEFKQAKIINQADWRKMQFLQNQRKFFSLSQQLLKAHQRYRLKLVFKDFSGTEIVFCVSSKPNPISLVQCDHRVRSQRIIKLPIAFNGSRKHFITFYASDITFFKFKFDFILEENEDQLAIRASSESRINFVNLPNLPGRSLYAQSKTQRSQNSLEMKQRQKSPKIQTKGDAMKNRLKLIEQEKVRLMQAQQRKRELSIYYQKNKQLRQISKRCGGLLQQYEQFYHEHLQRSEQSYRLIVMLVIMSKFIRNVSTETEERVKYLDDATHLRSVLKYVAARFMKVLRNLREIAPNPKIRELTAAKKLVQLQARTVHSYSQKNAEKIMIDCFNRVLVGANVNKAFVKSTEYRTKIRSIQKYWKQRNHAQLISFEEYINHQIQDLFKKHPQFKKFWQSFYERQIGKELSWQYLKQSSLKLKNIFGTYYVKLSEIEEMNQANLAIKIFNQQALKKYQKQYLLIPKVPSYPVCRYFRDITLLKSMTRTWFEIQHRKQSKTVQKQKKNEEE